MSDTKGRVTWLPATADLLITICPLKVNDPMGNIVSLKACLTCSNICSEQRSDEYYKITGIMPDIVKVKE